MGEGGCALERSGDGGVADDAGKRRRQQRDAGTRGDHDGDRLRALGFKHNARSESGVGTELPHVGGESRCCFARDGNQRFAGEVTQRELLFRREPMP